MADIFPSLSSSATFWCSLASSEFGVAGMMIGAIYPPPVFKVTHEIRHTQLQPQPLHCSFQQTEHALVTFFLLVRQQEECHRNEYQYTLLPTSALIMRVRRSYTWRWYICHIVITYHTDSMTDLGVKLVSKFIISDFIIISLMISHFQKCITLVCLQISLNSDINEQIY